MQSPTAGSYAPDREKQLNGAAAESRVALLVSIIRNINEKSPETYLARKAKTAKK